MTLRPLLFASLATLFVGCGDKDDDSGSGDGPGGTEVAYECGTMCTDLGFDAGTGQEYDHEVNCTCSGTGVVTDAACESMCTEIGWSSSETYSSTGGDIDSCQCS